MRIVRIGCDHQCSIRPLSIQSRQALVTYGTVAIAVTYSTDPLAEFGEGASGVRNLRMQAQLVTDCAADEADNTDPFAAGIGKESTCSDGHEDCNDGHEDRSDGHEGCSDGHEDCSDGRGDCCDGHEDCCDRHEDC